MNNIYTKTGDKGRTSLFSGERINKGDIRVKTYGTLDEASAVLGIAYSYIKNEKIKKHINTIQNHLIILCCEIATTYENLHKCKNLIEVSHIEYLEKMIDESMKICNPVKGFTIIGKNKGSAFLHQSRTIVRRSETYASKISVEGKIREETSTYINRLSDGLYALASLEEHYYEVSIIKEQVQRVLENIDIDSTKKESEKNLTTGICREMSKLAREKATQMNISIVFSVVDKGGNLLYLERMEDALIGSIDISINKAYTACAFKMETDKLNTLSRPTGELFGFQNSDRVSIIGGGLPYIYKGNVIGAIGVSGGTIKEDVKIGKHILDKIKKV